MKFKKGIYPKTIMRKFKDASIALAALLMKEKEFYLYLSVYMPEPKGPTGSIFYGI